MIRAALLIFLTLGTAFGAGVTEESILFSGVRFRVVRVPAARVQVVWKDEKGEPYRSFDKVQSAFSRKGQTVKFIMNAGIFEPGGIPSGLHVENQKTLHPLNLADAPGNFFLKPNGVLHTASGVGQTEPAIIDAASFPRIEPAPKPGWAIQSGPLLLIDGRRHPAFNQGSASRLPRNGVGVDDEKRLVFAITAKGEVVNFWNFAGLFLQLGCRNALFLDGDISQMAVNPTSPVDSNLFGAMFVVAE
ncbi:phosphodiester glycosidase family protein [Luteolibacter yonseiensis]|uniref:Phosphodiester glycosidase family protein n=1 Tax=Luteolibacter yonseiensis TaxID=1144680 RepID=A0A934VC45_9BACT|nr:phosphodiester glycosidase family protein [Luteolibacter yonseiensis]MBK1816591.1 phosphodiester glycosidase family protein [Luteolibacter yonseiensis]